MPVVVAGVIAGGVAVATAGSSDATPTLPARTAAQLLTAVQTSSTRALSGEVRQTQNLGLPSLPGGSSSASLSWQALLTGSHTARVWVAGPTRQRIAVLGQLSEADVVHDGRDLWTYTSSSDTVTHTVLPQRAQRTTTPADISPPAVARRLLAAVRPTTTVTVDPARTVAGRAAYTLALAPRQHRSTVRGVTIAIDAKTFVPLQVQVFGPSATPAFQVGFTKLSYATPAAARFHFEVPKGATVTTRSPLNEVRGHHGTPAHTTPSAGAPAGAPARIGSGWTTVLEFHGLGGGPAGTLGQLTSPVGSSGARLLHTALLNVLVLPDGRVFAGAVGPALLQHVAATTPH